MKMLLNVFLIYINNLIIAINTVKESFDWEITWYDNKLIGSPLFYEQMTQRVWLLAHAQVERKQLNNFWFCGFSLFF